MINKRELYFLFVISFIVLQVESANITNENKLERTFILLKPDSVHRGLIGEIIQRFEDKGFNLVAIKFMWATREMAEQHYNEHSKRHFFPNPINFMVSGPVVPMILERVNAVKVGRGMLGKSINDLSIPGTIRGDYSVHRERNVIHGAHSSEAVEREIELWYPELKQLGM